MTVSPRDWYDPEMVKKLRGLDSQPLPASPYATLDSMSPYPELKYDHCGYLGKALEAPAKELAINQAVYTLGQRDFDTIAVSGCSGLLFGPIVAYLMHKEILVVRKPSDKENHSRMTVEGHVGSRRYVIVDDCVSTGSTVRYIQEQIQQRAPHAKCVGIYGYTYESLGGMYSAWQDSYIR